MIPAPGDVLEVRDRGPWLTVVSADGHNVLARGPRGVIARISWDGAHTGRLANGRRVRFVRSAPQVKPGSAWRHTNGGLYLVLHITNTAHERPAHPPDVVYFTAGKPEHVWSRPLSDWHRSFTEEKT